MKMSAFWSRDLKKLSPYSFGYVTRRCLPSGHAAWKTCLPIKFWLRTITRRCLPSGQMLRKKLSAFWSRVKKMSALWSPRRKKMSALRACGQKKKTVSAFWSCSLKKMYPYSLGYVTRRCLPSGQTIRQRFSLSGHVLRRRCLLSGHV